MIGNLLGAAAALRAFEYPVSFLNKLTELRKNRFGINEPGEDPFS